MQLMINSKAPHKTIKCRYRGHLITGRIYPNYKESGRTYYVASAGGDLWDRGWYWSRGIPSVISQIDALIKTYPVVAKQRTK